jgi:hypothetical protein
MVEGRVQNHHSLNSSAALPGEQDAKEKGVESKMEKIDESFVAVFDERIRCPCSNDGKREAEKKRCSIVTYYSTIVMKIVMDAIKILMRAFPGPAEFSFLTLMLPSELHAIFDISTPLWLWSSSLALLVFYSPPTCCILSPSLFHGITWHIIE